MTMPTMPNMSGMSSSTTGASVSPFMGVLQGVDFESYKWVALVASLMMFQVVMIGMIPGGARSKLFTKEFLEKEFKEKHEAAFVNGTAAQKALPKGGYPDMGSGLYGEKL